MLLTRSILARLGRSDLPELRRLQPDPPLVQELKTLTRDQDAMIHMQTRLTNQLIACLKAYYPVALTWFDHVAQGVTLAMLEAFPSPTAFQAATPETVRPSSRAGTIRMRRRKRGNSGSRRRHPSSTRRAGRAGESALYARPGGTPPPRHAAGRRVRHRDRARLRGPR